VITGINIRVPQKLGEFVDHFIDCQILKENSALCNYVVRHTVTDFMYSS
jgi:hypothetical protein